MTLKQMLGLDTRAERYSYGNDPVAGYVSAQKVPDKWVATTCGYCSVGCGMFIGVKDGKAVSVRGNPDHKVNRGLLCPKGLSEHYTIRTDNRALYPMLRDGKTLQPHRLGPGVRDDGARSSATCRRASGPAPVGVISTGQLVTEEFYALGKLVQLGLGTNNYDGNTTLCMATAVQGYKRSFGSDGPPGTYEDLEKADVIILIGANIAENHPLLCWRLRSNPSTTLIVVDPRVTKTAMMADLHLPVKPRSDLALVNGLIHVVIEHNFVNRDYIERHTTGFDALREAVKSLHARARGRDHRHLARDDRPHGLALRPRQGRVHRLDDGREPQHQGHRDGQRDQQPRAHHRQHRPRGRGAVLDHRAVQRDGHARGGLRLDHARLPQVRERGRSRGAGRAVERAGRADPEQARAGLSRHHRGRARQARSARSGSSPPTRSCRSRISGR